jgi:hypothetical protein
MGFCAGIAAGQEKMIWRFERFYLLEWVAVESGDAGAWKKEVRMSKITDCDLG